MEIASSRWSALTSSSMPPSPPRKTPHRNESPSAQRRRHFTLLVFLIALAMLVLVVTPYIGAFFTAALLATIFHPIRVRMTRHLRGHKGIAAGILTAATVMVVVIPVGVIGVLVVNEGVQVAERLSSTLETSGVEGLLRPMPRWMQQPARYALSMLPKSIVARWSRSPAKRAKREKRPTTRRSQPRRSSSWLRMWTRSPSSAARLPPRAAPSRPCSNGWSGWVC
jgi:hypothetical protein